MSRRKLDVGAIVHFTRLEARTGAHAPEYRIEQLLGPEDGVTLYKIRSEAEPFDRIVAECDLTMRR
jgi:hypothetical protein